MSVETFCLILTVIGAIIASYSAAAMRERNRIIAMQTDRITHLQAEMLNWQNKAIAKAGGTPLGWETREKPKSGDAEITPRIVTRQQMEARAQSEAQKARANSVTVFADGVSASRIKREDVIEKAQEVIDATK